MKEKGVNVGTSNQPIPEIDEVTLEEEEKVLSHRLCTNYSNHVLEC